MICFQEQRERKWRQDQDEHHFAFINKPLFIYLFIIFNRKRARTRYLLLES